MEMMDYADYVSHKDETRVMDSDLQRGTCSLRPPPAAFHTLLAAGAAVCVCVHVSYCLLDIYINQLRDTTFPNITSDNVMNDIKALRHLYNSLRMLIVRWCTSLKINQLS